MHGCAGIWGMLATGLFATVSVNPGGADGLFNGNPEQLGRQALAVTITIAFVGSGTWVIGQAIGLLTHGLRTSAEDEENGLDLTEHGEVAYSGDNAGMPS